MARDKQGKWLQGSSGNPAGKRLRALSKAKQWQDEFFERDKAKAKEDWEKLSPYQRWTIRAKYWDFQFPKLRSEHMELDIDSMNDQFCGKIVGEILTRTIIDGNNEIRLIGPDERGK